MVKQILNKNWRMRRTGEPDQPAVVPGTVYTDLLRNGNMEDPFWRDNEIRALPLMEDDYEYEVCFDVGDELLEQDRVLLHFDGLDTIADIYLNQEHLGNARVTTGAPGREAMEEAAAVYRKYMNEYLKD